MRRTVQASVSMATMALVAGLSWLPMGCEAPGVGDPCEPEQVPAGGFVPTEAYLETSSVQCRTRVCMVYKLAGDPREECDPTQTVCPTRDQVDDRVYCTCRCRAPDDPNATVCECPEGYECTEVLTSEGAGPGIRGSYCVKSGTIQEG